MEESVVRRQGARGTSLLLCSAEARKSFHISDLCNSVAKHTKRPNLWQSAPDRCCSDESLFSSGESAAAAEQEAAELHPLTVALDSYLCREEKNEIGLMFSDG